MLAKRVIDLILSGAGLALCCPLLALLGGISLFKLGRPVLFKQMRGGLGGKPMMLLKLRTMTETRDENGNLLPDQNRLTPWGTFLRRYSLDELPQLWNVLRGDMSIVGPRPLLACYTERYDSFQRRRLEMRPGLTGLTQVYGRNSLTWDEKFALDVRYIDDWSLWLDCKLIAITVMRLFGPTDISFSTHATMPEFMGSAQKSLTAAQRAPGCLQ